MDYLISNPQGIDRAAQLLQQGGLVALPTETVYGLAACAENPRAIASVFTAKGRPADHPLIVHIPALAHLTRWACRIPAVAYQLAEAFWPGPLTLVLPAAADVSRLITGGQDTIAIRWSVHPQFQAVLDRLGCAVVAPSANPFGHISPTCAEHVQRHMEGRIDAVLDGGECRFGVESTILDLSGPEARILRPGCITARQLADFLPLVEAPSAAAATPRVPGALSSHYAPRLPCYRFELAERQHWITQSPAGRCAYIGLQPPPCTTFWQRVLPADPSGYASQIYATLHQAELSGSDWIVIEMPPDEAAWRHVRDRLGRASTPLV